MNAQAQQWPSSSTGAAEKSSLRIPSPEQLQAMLADTGRKMTIALHNEARRLAIIEQHREEKQQGEQAASIALALIRARQAAEIEKNPDLREKLYLAAAALEYVNGAKGAYDLPAVQGAA